MTNAAAVRQLGQSLGLELELSAGEAAELIVGDDLSLLISGDPDGQRLRLMGTVASFPDGDAAEVARTLLKANYNGQGTGGAAIALDPVTDDVVLTRAVDVTGLGPDGLRAAVEEFANYMEFWQSRIGTIVQPGTGTAGEAAPMAAMRV
jgi:hypothetical protein